MITVEEKTQKQFTEREINLANIYNVIPEAVRRLDTIALDWVEDSLKDANELWPSQDGEIKPYEWTGKKALREVNLIPVPVRSPDETLVEQSENQNPEDETQLEESEGDPTLAILKRFFNKCTLREKLVAMLMGELFCCESMFEKPDDSIGNDYRNKWKEELLQLFEKEDKIKQLEPELAALGAFTIALFNVQV